MAFRDQHSLIVIVDYRVNVAGIVDHIHIIYGYIRRLRKSVYTNMFCIAHHNVVSHSCNLTMVLSNAM